MLLYQSHQGTKRLIGKPRTEDEVAQMILSDCACRFTFPKHLGLFQLKPGVVFAEKRPDGFRYILENEPETIEGSHSE